MQHHAAVARKIHLSLLFSFPEPPLSALVPQIAAGFGATGTLDYIRMYPVTVNHDHETQLAAMAAQEVAGVANVTLDMPSVVAKIFVHAE